MLLKHFVWLKTLSYVASADYTFTCKCVLVETYFISKTSDSCVFYLGTSYDIVNLKHSHTKQSCEERKKMWVLFNNDLF